MKLIDKRYITLISINLIASILAGIALYYITNHINKKNND